MPSPNRPIVIVTGISGSGKTTALRAFEDRNFFCIDNLPIPLIPDFIRRLSEHVGESAGIALGVDIRNRSFLPLFGNVIDDLQRDGQRIQVLFLEASDAVVVRRFNESRRPHPLMDRVKDMYQAVAEEHRNLSDVRNRATVVMDSSNFNVHQLKESVFKFIDSLSGPRTLSVTLMSFGFKHGIPLESDLVFDLRFLPNPYFIPELRSSSGNDDNVYNFIFGTQLAEEFYQRLYDLVIYCLPSFLAEGKSYLTVSVGCTGGKHRSVAFARRLREDLAKKGVERLTLNIRHRDLGKE